MRAHRIARLTLVGLLTHGSGVCARPADATVDHGADPKTRTLDVRMSSTTTIAPATLRWVVVVDTHPDNRLLRVSIDGESFFQSSDIPLEGVQSARNHFVSWRDIPAGEYEATAVLYGPGGPRATRVRHFSVIGH